MMWRIEEDQIAELPCIVADFHVGCIGASTGGLLAVGERDGQRVDVYDLATDGRRQHLPVNSGRRVSTVALSGDGSCLAVGYVDGRIVTWRQGTDGLFDTTNPLELQAQGDRVSALVVHPRGEILAAGGKVWNVADGTLICDFGRENETVAAFSPHGDRLAVVHHDKNHIKIRRWPTRDEIFSLPSHFYEPSGVDFFPDGQTLVSSSIDRTVKLWDLKTGEQRFSLSGGRNIFESLAVSPDGNTIAAGGRFRTIHIFRAATRESVEKSTR